MCDKCVEYYESKFCAECGSRIPENMDLSKLLDTKIKFNGWSVYLEPDQETLILETSRIRNPEQYLDKIIVSNSSEHIPGSSSLTLFTGFKVRGILNSLNKKIKLVDTYSAEIQDSKLVIKFLESEKSKLMDNLFNKITKLFTRLYLDETLQTESEIRKKYSLEFELLNIKIEDLFEYKGRIHNIDIYYPNSEMKHLIKIRNDRVLGYCSIFQKFKLTEKYSNSEIIMKLLFGLDSV